MKDMQMDSIAEVLHKHGVKVPQEILPEVLEDILEALDALKEYSSYGTPSHDRPLADELAKAKAELKQERSLVFCTTCQGMRTLTDPDGCVSACWKCGGQGKHPEQRTFGSSLIY